MRMVKLRLSRKVVGAVAFQRYAPELHRYLSRRVTHPASVADLTQEIFERFLKLPDTDSILSTQGFLYGIASNLVREYRDRESRGFVIFDSDAVDAASERLEQAAPDDLAERLAMQQEMRRALGQLPKVHRLVLLLVKREGLTYAEAARKTGLEVDTVAKYVYEARAKMKQLLKRASG